MNLFKLAIQLIGLLLGVVTFVIGISLSLVILAIGLHIFGKHETADKVENLNVKLWRGIKAGFISLISKSKEM